MPNSANNTVDQSQQILTMEQRTYLCNRLQCSLKDLIIAEDAVGSNPDRIIQYLKDQEIL